jgi:hypothetical protein
LYILHTTTVNSEAATDQGTYKQQLRGIVWFLRNVIVFSLKTVPHVPKHVAEAQLMFIIIKNVQLFGIINGVR